MEKLETKRQLRLVVGGQWNALESGSVTWYYLQPLVDGEEQFVVFSKQGNVIVARSTYDASIDSFTSLGSENPSQGVNAALGAALERITSR